MPLSTASPLMSPVTRAASNTSWPARIVGSTDGATSASPAGSSRCASRNVAPYVDSSATMAVAITVWPGSHARYAPPPPRAAERSTISSESVPMPIVDTWMSLVVVESAIACSTSPARRKPVVAKPSPTYSTQRSRVVSVSSFAAARTDVTTSLAPAIACVFSHAASSLAALADGARNEP